VARVRDAYAYHRFVPLFVEQPEFKAPAGIPSRHLVPEYMFYVETLTKRALPPEEVVVPFDVDGVFDPVQEPVDVKIDNVDEVLISREVMVGRKRVQLPPDGSWVGALLRGEEVVVDTGNREYVRLRPTVAEAAVPSRIAVTDLSELLASRAATGTVEARVASALDASRLSDLRSSGRTSLELDGQRVLLERSTANGTNGTVATMTSASTAAITSTADSSIRLVEDHPKMLQVQKSVALPQMDTDVRFAVWLSYVQEWELLGYGRGELLNSIALTAGEEVTVELRSWDRSSTVTERSSGIEQETSLEVQSTSRRTASVLSEVTRANDWKMTVGGSVSLPVAQPVSVGATITSEAGGSIQRVNQGTLEQVDEAVWRASNRVKTTQQTKVVVSREVGSESRTVKVLRNLNDTRSLTYDLFEVLASYRVRMRPERQRLAVLIPNPIPVPADRAALLVHEGALRSALLDPAYESGFRAARLLAAQERFCDFAEDQSCAGSASTGAAAGQAAAPPASSTTPAPATGSSTAAVDAARKRVVESGDRVASAIRALRTAGHAKLTQTHDNNAPQADKDRGIVEFRQWLYRTFGLEMFNGSFWTHCLRYSDGWQSEQTPERVESVVGGAERAWLETTLKGIAAAALFQLAVPLFAARFVAEFGFKSLWYAGFATSMDDAGLGDALSAARREVDNWRKALETAAEAASAPPAQIPPAPAATPAPVATVAEPLQRPWSAQELAEAAVSEQVLLDHLKANRGHYQAAIWAAMDPVDRAAQLDLYGPLGSYVGNEVLGFVGDRIALPFNVDTVPDLQRVVDQIAQRSVSDLDEVSRDVVLPTPGVHIQSRLGSCDTAEPYVQELRALDLEERKARVELIRRETETHQLDNERRRKRLSHKPPLLDADPVPTALNVHVEPES
jgi:hypothetical protein